MSEINNTLPPETPNLPDEQSKTQIILNPETNYVMTMWNDTKLMTSAFKMAEMLSKSTFIPIAYQQNPPNCLIAIDIANRMNMPPLMVLQNLYIVQGRPAWSGQFCIAAVNGCGQFEKLEFVFNGE